MRPSGDRTEMRADVWTALDQAGRLANALGEPGGARGMDPRNRRQHPCRAVLRSAGREEE